MYCKQEHKIIKRKRIKDVAITSTSTTTLNENQENETLQQIKRLRLLSFTNNSPQQSPLQTDNSKRAHKLLDDYNSNSCSLDSGFSQQQQQTDDLELDSDDELSFRITNKHKLLDISNCSAQSTNSISSPFQARRCLFKTMNKMQLTPVSTTNTIVTTNDENNDLILSHLFNNQENEQMDHENIMKLLDLEHNRAPLQATAFTTDCLEQRRLIGDRSSYHILPTKTNIKHNDLNVITAETLTNVLNGDYKSQVDNLVIIDSRYPYEFEGGHIKTAKNVFTKESIIDLFLKEKPMMTSKTIVIFHCEFSSERGPGLLRFLRSQDRLINKDSYPKLFYPELYLLEGGYKSFYEQCAQYCEPQLYKPMLHKDHVNDLKHFRAKTKTWESQHKYLTSNCYSSVMKMSTTQSRLEKKTNVLLNRFQRFPRSNLF